MLEKYGIRARIILVIVMFLFCRHVKSVAGDESQQHASAANAARIIDFAGVSWNVRTGGPAGPGPNYWSDSSDNVWVDEQGRLHLKIVRKANVWYCSEVYTTEFTTYGEHRFLIEGRIDRMDKQIVLGLFAYAADDAEVDIEFSKWGDRLNARVGGFTIQPYNIAGNNFKFDSKLTGTKSTHYFNWQADSVQFGSMQGHYYGEPADPNEYIQQWTHKSSYIPDTSRNLRLHINFWLYQGQAPTDLSMLEVIIADVMQPLRSDASTPDKPVAAPQSMRLEQNYPNPFNGATRICYQLFQQRRVRLDVFDSSGRLVKKLLQQEQPPGRYDVRLDSAGMSSGVYYCRLQAGQETRIRKMLLLR